MSAPRERDYEFAVGITDEGKVMLHFGNLHIDHLKLTPEQARRLADALVETAREADLGYGNILRMPRR